MLCAPTAAVRFRLRRAQTSEYGPIRKMEIHGARLVAEKRRKASIKPI